MDRTCVAEPPQLGQGPCPQPPRSAGTQQKLLPLQWALRPLECFLMKGFNVSSKTLPFMFSFVH